MTWPSALLAIAAAWFAGICVLVARELDKRRPPKILARLEVVRDTQTTEDRFASQELCVKCSCPDVLVRTVVKLRPSPTVRGGMLDGLPMFTATRAVTGCVCGACGFPRVRPPDAPPWATSLDEGMRAGIVTKASP